MENTLAFPLLRRLLERSPLPLSAPASQYFLSLRFQEDEIARMNELSEKAQLGSLSPQDAAELDAFLHVSNFLALLQAKSRRAAAAPAAG